MTESYKGLIYIYLKKNRQAKKELNRHTKKAKEEGREDEENKSPFSNKYAILGTILYTILFFFV